MKQLFARTTICLAHLENVRLSLAVVAREGCIHWPFDAPHVLDEFWVTGENRFVIQFKEVLTWEEKTVTEVEPGESRKEKCCNSPLKANMEPFFICMKASKGLPLQTSASGSGASVVPVVTGTVVFTLRLV